MNKEKGNRWRGRFVRYAPVFVIVLTIFVFSNSAASFSNTSRFIGPILAWLLPNADIETLRVVHVGIRKLAHLSEYGVLGFLAANAFRGSHFSVLKSKAVYASLALVLLVASLDELNQSFSPQRTGSGVDVLIDCVGGFIGAMTLVLWVSLYRKIKG